MDYTAEQVYELLGVVNWNKIIEYNYLMEIEETDYAFVEAGATQGCIISKKDDFVVKFPLDGEYHHHYSGGYYDENDEWIEETDDAELIEFNYADDGGDGSNYSEAALLKYDLAREFGFDDMLAKIEYFGIHKGHKIYIQEKCSFYPTGGRKTRTKEEKEALHKIYKEEHTYDTFSDEFALEMIEFYGEQRFRDFCHFINENGFNDLHDNNIGYAADGRPVLVDYAGYFE